MVGNFKGKCYARLPTIVGNGGDDELHISCRQHRVPHDRSRHWPQFPMGRVQLVRGATIHGIDAACGHWYVGVGNLWPVVVARGQALGGCVFTFFLVAVMRTKSVGSLWVNHWPMGLSMLGMVLMAAHFLR